MSETITITGAQAIELLRRAVAEKGRDHKPKLPDVGTGCYYRAFSGVDDNGGYAYPEGEPIPVCGVGYALSYVGLLNKIGPYDNILTIAGMTLDELTPEAEEVFSSFQSAQDSGTDWGMALDNAEATATRLGIAVKHA